MCIMGKITGTVVLLVVLSVCSLVYAFLGDKEYSTYAWIGAFGFAVIAMIGYSCDNAAKVPDNYPDKTED